MRRVRFPSFESSGQGGFSLTSILVALGLGGIVAAVSSQLITGQFKAQKRVELRQQVLGLYSDIRERIDCDETLKGIDLTTLSAPIPVAIKFKSALSTSTWLPAEGGKKGDFTLVADATSTGVKVKAARLKDGVASPRLVADTEEQSFLDDPLNGRKWTWGYSDFILKKQDQSFGDFCYGAYAGTPGRYQLSCIDVPAPTCFRLDTETGKVECRFLGGSPASSSIPWASCVAGSPFP